MGINSYLILFSNNPNKTYCPGDTVFGQVLLDLNSAKRVRAIKIRFKGKCKTQWKQGSGKNTRHYNGKEIYFEQIKFLVQAGDEPFDLPVGKHTYDFNFALPAALPTSVSHENGKIKYSVKVTLDRPWKFDNNVKNEFFITQPLDLNEIDFVKVPATLTMEREFCFCFSRGKIITYIKVPCSGFVCGQTVPLIIEIVNNSNVKVEDLVIRFKKYHVFYTTNRKSKKSVSELVSLENNLHVQVGARSTNTFFHNFSVPHTLICNVNSCSIIDILYKFKFKIILSGLHMGIPGELPIMIGNIPLNYITPIEELGS